MRSKIRELKYLIGEYEELFDELEQMSEDWDHGSPEAAAMSDPSDQYMKGMEIERKYEEIKQFTKEL